MSIFQEPNVVNSNLWSCGKPVPHRTQGQASPRGSRLRADPKQSPLLPPGVAGDGAETGTLESCFPGLRAGNSAVVLGLEGPAGGAQSHPQSPSLGRT